MVSHEANDLHDLAQSNQSHDLCGRRVEIMLTAVALLKVSRTKNSALIIELFFKKINSTSCSRGTYNLN